MSPNKKKKEKKRTYVGSQARGKARTAHYAALFSLHWRGPHGAMPAYTHAAHFPDVAGAHASPVAPKHLSPPSARKKGGEREKTPSEGRAR